MAPVIFTVSSMVGVPLMIGVIPNPVRKPMSLSAAVSGRSVASMGTASSVVLNTEAERSIVLVTSFDVGPVSLVSAVIVPITEVSMTGPDSSERTLVPPKRIRAAKNAALCSGNFIVYFGGGFWVEW